MKIILSPAKTMRVCEGLNTTTPVFMDLAINIRGYLKSLTKSELKEIWKCNDKLADSNIEALNKYRLDSNLTQAIYAYDGLQYKNIMVSELDSESLSYLNSNLRIISGMYGVLKPTDGIIPYRLEMQASISYNGYKSLYDYWKDKIFKEISFDDKLIINLCSKEYSDAFMKYKDNDTKIITINFYSLVNGKLKTKGTLAKMLRGRLVRYMALNKVDDIEKIKSFSELGFSYSSEHSSENVINFIEN